MKAKKLLIVSALIYIMMLFIAINAVADFGDFSGDSDYGGSDSSWSSSDSDWGSSNDSNWDSNSDSGSYSNGHSGGRIATILIGTNVLMYILVAVLVFKKLRKAAAAARSARTQVTDSPTLYPISQYRQRDPGFSDQALCERISNLYVQMQNCWTAKDIEPLRSYFTEAAYAQFDRQLNNYRQNKRTNYVEHIVVRGIELYGWYKQANDDCMVATVRTSIVDYTRDDRTGQIISGSDTAEKFMTYEYILIRSSGCTTDTQSRNNETINCPGCRVPLNINHGVKCPNCNNIITAKNYVWVISSIKGISQQTRS